MNDVKRRLEISKQYAGGSSARVLLTTPKHTSSAPPLREFDVLKQNVLHYNLHIICNYIKYLQNLLMWEKLNHPLINIAIISNNQA